MTPYGVAKAYGHMITRSYRRRYGLHASAGILYNHESPRRPLDFLPRKVARGAAAISLGLQSDLWLGDLTARRDWGYAADYVRAMWLMLQQDDPADYVIATGEAHTPQEFCELAFERVGLDWEKYVEVDESYFRPSEVDYLLGDASLAKERLGWEPKVRFPELVRIMVDADVQLLEDELAGRLVRQDRDH